MNISRIILTPVLLSCLFSCNSGPSIRVINERMSICENQYNSSSWIERQKCVREASTYKNERAHAFLLIAVHDENPSVRVDAMRGTQKYFHLQTSPEIFADAAENDKSEKVRYEALSILTKYGLPQYFPLYVTAFNNSDWLFREIAITGIISINDEEIEKQSIVYIVKAVRDPSQNVKIAALYGTKIKNPLIYEEIRSLFYEKDYEKKVTILIASLHALQGYDLDIRLRERVKQLIVHENTEVRILALRVLKSEPAYKRK